MTPQRHTAIHRDANLRSLHFRWGDFFIFVDQRESLRSGNTFAVPHV
jgi:hypothetical protein